MSAASFSPDATKVLASIWPAVSLLQFHSYLLHRISISDPNWFVVRRFDFPLDPN